MTPRDAAYFTLVQEWRAAKPGKARDRLFATLAKSQAKHLKFYTYKFQSMTISVSQEDLDQAAQIGFLRALNQWDPKRGAWITCLFIWVRREIQNYTALEPVVYRPHGVAKPYKVHRAEEAFEARAGKRPEAKDLDVPERKWQNWERDAFFTKVELKDTSRRMVTDETTLDPEQVMMNREENEALSALTEDEKVILLGPPSEAKEAIRARFI